ncbi:hypothetical protein [Ruegeria conchae]|uniref:hypothetical protein n=1 Tax=Ruegeria conchae TaxID=981384 RepID=UPI002882EF2E|nr:hypothetical protein [Ruegeria conchae]
MITAEVQADTPQIAADREELIIGAQAGRLDDVMRRVIGSGMLAPGSQQILILDDVLQMAGALGPDVFVRQMRILQRRPDQQGT